MGIEDRHDENIVIWNLRGHALPLDRLAPLLIRRMKGEAFSAVIIDPIYKVITGDEKPSAQWEHTFLMTEHGVEILSY